MRVASNSKRFAVVAVVVLLYTGAFAQQDGDLKQRLQELKQQYEQTTLQLEQRIGALEQQIEQQKEQASKKQKEEEKQNAKTVLAADLGTQQEVTKIFNGQSTQVGAEFQGQLPMQPTCDELQEAETKIKGRPQEQLHHVLCAA
jgi:maltoporin